MNISQGLEMSRRQLAQFCGKDTNDVNVFDKISSKENEDDSPVEEHSPEPQMSDDADQSPESQTSDDGEKEKTET